jgi:hypothetical protein
MTRFTSLALATAFVFALAGTASAQSIDGVWEVSLDTPQGVTTIDATMKQQGETVTGQVTSPLGSVEFKGTFVNDTLTIAYAVPVQGQTIDITMNGKRTGDTMSGMVNFGGLGEAPWTAKRKPANTAAAPAAPAAAAGAGGPASGKWDIVLVMGPAGEFPMTADFTQAGEKVTGTINSQMGSMPVTGSMVGDALKLEFVAPTPNGDLAITMTGTLGSDGFSGKTTVPGLGDADWTGKRAK